MTPALSPARRSEQAVVALNRIPREQMAGLPSGNNELAVETIGFREIQGERVAGMAVTPWMMSLLVFSAGGDAWETLALGDKQSFAFPSGPCRCVLV